MAWKPNREDLAWAAGFFDGEGSTSAIKRTWGNPPRSKSYVRMSIRQKAVNREVLDKFCRITGLGKVGSSVETACGPMHHWYLQRYEHCQALLAMLWPWLGTAKKQQAIKRLREELDGIQVCV